MTSSPLDASGARRLLVFTCLFLLGFWSNPQCNFQPETRRHNDAIESESSIHQPSGHNSAAIREQVKAMNEFQSMIQVQQEDPSNCSRILILSIPYHPGQRLSWIDSLEILAKAMKVSLSTQRRLVLSIQNNDDGSFCGHAEHERYCLFMESTNTDRCPKIIDHGEGTSNARRLSSGHGISPLRKGITDKKSEYFNTQYYGDAPVAVLPDLAFWPWQKSWLIDAGLSWERRWGAFWVRSQLLFYLYKTVLMYPRYEDKGRNERITLVWDEMAKNLLRLCFARNSANSQPLDREAAIGDYIDSVYMQNGDSESQHKRLLITPPGTQDTSDIHNFSFPDIPTDWEVDTKARLPSDAMQVLVYSGTLIGSFSGAWFRVSAAIAMAIRIPSSRVQEQRFWGVDVEWLEHFGPCSSYESKQLIV